MPVYDVAIQFDRSRSEEAPVHGGKAGASPNARAGARAHGQGPARAVPGAVILMFRVEAVSPEQARVEALREAGFLWECSGNEAGRRGTICITKRKE